MITWRPYGSPAERERERGDGGLELVKVLSCWYKSPPGLILSQRLQFRSLVTHVVDFLTFFDADLPSVTISDLDAGDGGPARREVVVESLPCPLVREGNAQIVHVRQRTELPNQQRDSREKP